MHTHSAHLCRQAQAGKMSIDLADLAMDSTPIAQLADYKVESVYRTAGSRVWHEEALVQVQLNAIKVCASRTFACTPLSIIDCDEQDIKVDMATLPDSPLSLGLRVACGDEPAYISDQVAGVVDRAAPQAYFSNPSTIMSPRDVAVSFSEPVNCNTVRTSVLASATGSLKHMTDYFVNCNGKQLEFVIATATVLCVHKPQCAMC